VAGEAVGGQRRAARGNFSLSDGRRGRDDRDALHRLGAAGLTGTFENRCSGQGGVVRNMKISPGKTIRGPQSAMMATRSDLNGRGSNASDRIGQPSSLMEIPDELSRR